jgi:hypothetical protein
VDLVGGLAAWHSGLTNPPRTEPSER